VARLAVDGPDGAGGVEQLVVAERPGQLRLESRDFFGNVLAQLAVDGEALALYDARARVFYRGAATAENVGRLVPVALAPVDLVTLLCGSAPLLEGEPLEVTPADGALRLTVRRADSLQRLDVGEGAVVLHARSSRGGAAGLEVDLAGHRPYGEALLPREVTARAPAAGVALSLRWKEVEVNRPIDPALFRLAPPDGARIVDLAPPSP
jgi:hypothetical protein